MIKRLAVAGSSVLASLALTMMCACSGADPRGPALSSGNEETTSAALVEGCPSGGASRECLIVLASHAGVPNCAPGVQECTADGGWSACHAPAPDAGAPDATPAVPFVPEPDSNP